jgi:DmsE family decaheme c-type cytochrome
MQLTKAILMAVVGMCLAANASGNEGAAQIPVGNQVCKTCHADFEAHKTYAYHSDCTACHTLVDEKHVVDGGKTVQFPDAQKCLDCHRTQDVKRMNWAFTEHGRAKLDCRDCHGVHAPKQPKQMDLALWKSDRGSAICLGCHQEVAARLTMFSHHPVREGALSCLSCHDPHDGKSSALIAKNDRCYGCHQAIRGPKVFEHPPVVEDCGICHHPHGSGNRRLLQVAQPMQCLQCHSLATNMHARRTGGPNGAIAFNGAQLRNCVNCHGAIHGSHVDPVLKY